MVETRTDPESKLDIDPVCGMSVYRSQACEHDLFITFADRVHLLRAGLHEDVLAGAHGVRGRGS